MMGSFSKKLRRSDTDPFFEKACEVVRELESEQSGSLIDIVPLHQQTFALVDHIGVDITDGCCTCRTTKQVAEVMRGIGHL